MIIVSFLVPIAIASYFGSIFSGPSRDAEAAKINVMIVDPDGSAIAKGIVSAAQADASLRTAVTDAGTARDASRRGRAAVGVVIPGGFGEKAGAAFFTNSAKPEPGMLYDPSRNTELAMVRGIMTEHVMQAVSREMFGGARADV